MSRLDLLVGPNGAGKTTVYEYLIAPDRPGLPFVNADRIASSRFPGQESKQAYAAARIAVTARDALIAQKPLEDLALLLGYGAEKYAARNWEQGFAWSRAYNALMRHLVAFWSGEDVDPESGAPHMVAVMCNAMFLAEFVRTHPEHDNRPGVQK